MENKIDKIELEKILKKYCKKSKKKLKNRKN